ncbi:MAG: NAD(P)-binding domain-containing protein, partial [bacterium]|nr:NAD(P)-binding domain-containing protein [bacterium]
MSKKIAVLGAGAFGIALAKVLAENKNQVCLWTRNVEVADYINLNRCHPFKLKGILLPSSIYATTNLKEAVDSVDIVILALPMIALRETINLCKSILP